MATTIIDPGDFSDYSDCQVTIEVIGGCHRALMRKAKYIKTIPYSCLSQTIQGINRLGGKITRVTLSPSHTQLSNIELVQPQSDIVESNVHASAHHAESHFSSLHHQEQNHSSESCQIKQPTPVKNEPQPIPVLSSGEYTFTEEWL
ncbi:hypothetical protein HCG51_25280 [Tolypothrix sp. PCC 7910]|uniref:phycobilisome linker polypeptide n=1 Tax=Tolypothrix sp. PCC 7910 TaxID=2099387 RepID=UPI001427A066|nr:phycobilisome linker polypeptide [Tolypothrix sp. PCC 7910]QIR39700.1 hypothetical protein HCG51_25280 [Tolypothrix sp. PCC 7910]